MSRNAYDMEMCSNELWEGVCCDLPDGHKGPHHRAATRDGAALCWRSIPAPAISPPVQPAMFRLADMTAALAP